jgi:hypothetical protein
MSTKFVTLDDTRIPGFPDAPVHLDRAPIQIVDDADARFNENTGTSNLTTAIGITSVLYRWCPSALHAFLDIDAWFSFTWTLTIQDEMKIEIGRVENQITIGKLDAEGEKWTLMLTFNITAEGPQRGAWVPNPVSEATLAHGEENAAPVVCRVCTYGSLQRWHSYEPALALQRSQCRQLYPYYLRYSQGCQISTTLWKMRYSSLLLFLAPETGLACAQEHLQYEFRRQRPDVEDF